MTSPHLSNNPPPNTTRRIEVLVNGISSGHLVQEVGQIFYQYHHHSTPIANNPPVSLTMPVRIQSYLNVRLPPIFEMHLPEGYLEAVIKKQFAKLVTVDDFGMLNLVANTVKGRVSFNSQKLIDEAHSKATTAEPALTLNQLIAPNNTHLFEELVGRFALQSPLSGVQPKVLVGVENKATLKLDDYIVKAWGDDYPQLAINEFFCMTAARLAGLNVPEFHLSNNDALFIIKRFDLGDNGDCYGFEDFCVLQGKPRDLKYTGSYEQLAKSLKQFVSSHQRHPSLCQLFKLMVLNNALQNGDAHLKNFGILYANINDIAMAPVYDIVSTTAYITHDVPALTFKGSKRWQTKPQMIQFGIDHCALSEKQALQHYQQCEEALRLTRTKIQLRLQQEMGLIAPCANKVRVMGHLMGLMISG